LLHPRAAAVAAVALSTALVGACTEAPVTGRQQLILTSEAEAAQMGQQAYREILGQAGVSQDQALQARVDRVGERIADAVGGETDWEFTVIDDDTANAFALPGGKVGVHTGLFQVVESDDQLAAVLAHEIAHVTAQHASERMSREVLTQTGLGLLGAATESQALPQILAQAATLGIQLPFSRSQEAEADEIGLHYMAKAGYDPRAAVEVWQNFAKLGGERPPEFLSTHPSPGNRITRLQNLIPKVLPVYRQNAG
jgi:predicted Zn-dependent protease